MIFFGGGGGRFQKSSLLCEITIDLLYFWDVYDVCEVLLMLYYIDKNWYHFIKEYLE